MDEDELVHGLVNSLAFEVEAIPQDNVIKFNSTNGTPLNVKVRVRNKDEPRLVQRGIVSVPKLGKHIASLDQIKLISSDQTILSFNVYMETELKKQSSPKNRKRGFNFFKLGGCLGTSYDEDGDPYLPGPSRKKALRSRTSSKSDSNIHNENVDVTEKRKLNLETSTATSCDQKRFFGKCKPGGCLDPPFGEDKEPYRPVNAQAHIKPKQTVKVEVNKKGQSIGTSGVVPGQSSKESTKLLRTEPNKDVMEPTPLLDIYARPVSVEHSSTSNYSNAATRPPSKMSSSKILDAGKKSNKTYDDDSLTQSYQYPETYYIPPKDILQQKEEERKYSRERSNDQIRPATTRRENDHRTSDTPRLFDVHENADAKCPQTMKLSKHKGKDNTERIKQTLTDLTSNEIENTRKSSEDYRKNSKIPLYVPLTVQKNDISSDYKETPSHDVTYLKYLDDFEIPIALEDLDRNIISETDPKEAKNKEQHQNVPPGNNKKATENNLEEKQINAKLDEPENQTPSKDMRTNDIFEIEAPIKSALISGPISPANLESGKIENLYVSPTLVSGQDEVKILRSVLSSDTQKIPKVGYLLSGSNSTVEDKPTKTSHKIKNATNSAVLLPSLENVLDDTNEKNKTMPNARLKNNPEYENSNININTDTAKYINNIQKSSGWEITQEQTNESQKSTDGKKINEDSDLLVSDVDDEKIKESLRTSEIPKKQMKGSKNVQEELIKDLKTSNELEFDGIKKPSNDFNDIEDSENKTLQDVDSEIYNNEQLNNLIGIESRDEPSQEKLDDPNSKETPNNDREANKSNTDLITDQKLMQNTAPSKTFQKSILHEHYQKTKQNENIDQVPNSTPETEIAENFIHDPINSNRHIVNSPDFKDFTLDDKGKDSTVETKKLDDITKETSNYPKNFGKELQDNNNIKGNESDIQETNVENAFDSDCEKLSEFANTVGNSSLIHQPIDTSIKNHKTFPVLNLSHTTIVSIVSDDKESTTSSTNIIESSNKLKTNNLNYEYNKKDPRNVHLTDNDNLVIENTSLHDRNKNLCLNTQDRTPSAILQKTPLVRTDDSELFNDDISVIKPFKRNTFTIVASNTSLEKQEESTLTPHTDHVTDDYLDAKNDGKFVPNDHITNSERFAQNDQQRNNGTETILIDPFLNFSTQSKTSLVSHDQPRESHSEEKNRNKVSGSENQAVTENQKNGSTEVTLNTNDYDKFTTKNYEEYPLASDIASKDINIVDTGACKSQAESDIKIYKTEKLINDISTDFAKRISELQHRSDNDFENIDFRANLEMAPQINEKLVDDDLNYELNNTKVDNYTIQVSNSKLRNNTEDLFNKKTSISNIPINFEEAERFLTKEPVKGVNDMQHLETVPLTSDDKSDINSARNAMEYGSRLLEISEGKLDHELRVLRNTVEDIRPLTGVNTGLPGEPNDTFQKLFEESPIKVDNKNAELDSQSIHTHDQDDINYDKDSYLKETTDLSTVESFSKIIDKNSLVPGDSFRYYAENNTATSIDEGDNLRIILESRTMGIFDKILDNSRNYAENKTSASIDEGDNLRIISESGAMGSFDKIIDSSRNYAENKTSASIDDGDNLGIISVSRALGSFDKMIDSSRNYAKNKTGTSIDEGSNLRKISESVTMGSFDKIIDSPRYHAENKTGTSIDEGGNLRKKSESVAMGSFDKTVDKHSVGPKDDTGYDNEYDGGIKSGKLGDLRKLSEPDSVGSFKKDIDKTPIVSEYGTRYDSFSKIYENGDLRKTSKPDSVGIFNEVTDKELLSAKYDVTRDIEQDNVTKIYDDGEFKKISDYSDAFGSFRKAFDKKPPAPEDGTKYYSDNAPPSKVPISTDKLSNIDQPGTKTHLDTIAGKQLREQSDSVIMKQQDGTIIKAYNQNENMPIRTDSEGTISNPIQKTKSEVLFLNLALQSYVNGNNETVVQTLNPLVEPVRYTDDNVTVVQSLIRHGHEIKIPVDVENDLALKFMSKIEKVPQYVNADQNSSKKIRITKNLSEHAHHHSEDIDESLAFIYERELIPLHNIIKNLTKEINSLTTQQELLKDKLRGAKRTKSLRLIPVSKRCGCGRM